MEIISMSCNILDIPFLTLKSICKKRKTANARYMIIYLLRNNTILTQEFIGNIFGGRNHSTISVAYLKAVRFRKRELLFREVLDDLENKIFN